MARQQLVAAAICGASSLTNNQIGSEPSPTTPIKSTERQGKQQMLTAIRKRTRARRRRESLTRTIAAAANRPLRDEVIIAAQRQGLL